MDIYSYLKKDHKKVNQLFKKLSGSKSGSQRKSYYEQIKQELTLHADTEKVTFYAALNEHNETQEDAEHGEEEHDEIKAAIAKLDKLRTNTIEWYIQIGVLKQIVEHHVYDEEHKMFDDAKKVLSDSQAEELAIEMDDLKKQKKLSKTKK